MTYKVLGQVAPSATTATTLYTVPASTETIASTLTVCNRSTAATYRIAVRPAGASLDTLHYIVYDAALAANSTESWSIGMTLATTDVVTVYASSANTTFALFGQEGAV